jgi:phosphoglycolate phosphatase
MNLKALFFDLDGTLINSRDDLADSVNLALAAMGFATLPFEMIAGFVGGGIFNLLNRSLSASMGETASEELTAQAVERFREIYIDNCVVKTELYDGVVETLEALGPIKKVVVTNKPLRFSMKILHALGVSGYFEFVTGGDSFAERKPHAMPLLETARLLNVAPEDCIMIGDSGIDIEAGKNAGMRTIGCTFGFRGRAELEKAGADHLIDEFVELAPLLRSLKEPSSEKQVHNQVPVRKT